MAKLDLTVPHQLPLEEAQARIETLFEQLEHAHRDKMSRVIQTWDGPVCRFSFTITGFDVEGTLSVNQDSIAVLAKLPWAASLFKGKIESTIREKASQLLT